MQCSLISPEGGERCLNTEALLLSLAGNIGRFKPKFENSELFKKSSIGVWEGYRVLWVRLKGTTSSSKDAFGQNLESSAMEMSYYVFVVVVADVAAATVVVVSGSCGGGGDGAVVVGWLWRIS